ncbi:molybdopterin molybdotransferase MoeA [Methanobrevibacter curvatus]|uniref:Molybdopterin molybdenumtransferase n=1 Tax=Methanobrevibacter curvatus TaxID=49547 RepID=A0A166B1Z6_9EURY|nr:molybdopterin molybdotransferase MoeA [Methanobrevibacter curvatus]KZX12762.1 molybdopterin molybdenumtransferase [Methanobrevibacter curvatus]
MFLTELIKLSEAKRILNENQIILDGEIIDLKDSYLRVLKDDIYSKHDSPPFDKSAMDGYAVIAEDTFTSSPNNIKVLKIIDRIGAGNYSEKTIEKGEAIKVATGSPVPKGGNAVLMEEYTISNGENLEIHGAVTPSENIAPQGEDIKVGEKILEKNTILRSQEMGLIASGGYGKAEVYKKPLVKLIVTGNELVEPGSTLKKAEVINSNKFTITGMLKSLGLDVEIDHSHDEIQELKEKILNSTDEYDVIITTGGTAISKGDIVIDVIEDVGEVLFHGVAIRPGKPFGFGVVNKTPVFMLSGYPVAAMGQFDTLVREYLLKMQNITFNPKKHKRISNVKIPSSLGRTDFVRAYSTDESVEHALNKGSGIIKSMVEANSYLIIDENKEGIEKGETVEIIYFELLNLNK